MQGIKIKPVLWTYKKSSNDEFEIRIRVTQYKEVIYLNTGYTATPNNWDYGNDCPRSTHPKFKPIIKQINDMVEELRFEIMSMGRSGVDFISLRELRDRVRQVTKRAKPIKIIEYFNIVSEDLKTEGRIGYANVFISAKSALEKYLVTDKLFTNFTKHDFEEYEKYLRRTGVSDSTISVYIRTFNRLWNLAIQKGYCPKEHHPSRYFTFKAYRRFKTRKRAVSIDVMQSIANLELEKSSRIYRSQQMFLFSYYARGINFSDLAKLTYLDNLRGNEIIYIRSKNKRRYQYKLHSKAVAIIEWFRNCGLQSDSGHVFPILMSSHNTPLKVDSRIDSALKDMNEDLKEIANKLGLKQELTSYVARHSFATNLRQKNVDINIIQEAMGHETQLQTMTYLEEIDDSIISKSIEESLI